MSGSICVWLVPSSLRCGVKSPTSLRCLVSPKSLSPTLRLRPLAADALAAKIVRVEEFFRVSQSRVSDRANFFFVGSECDISAEFCVGDGMASNQELSVEERHKSEPRERATKRRWSKAAERRVQELSTNSTTPSANPHLSKSLPQRATIIDPR